LTRTLSYFSSGSFSSPSPSLLYTLRSLILILGPVKSFLSVFRIFLASFPVREPSEPCFFFRFLVLRDLELSDPLPLSLPFLSPVFVRNFSLYANFFSVLDLMSEERELRLPGDLSQFLNSPLPRRIFPIHDPSEVLVCCHNKRCLLFRPFLRKTPSLPILTCRSQDYFSEIFRWEPCQFFYQPFCPPLSNYFAIRGQVDFPDIPSGHMSPPFPKYFSRGFWSLVKMARKPDLRLNTFSLRTFFPPLLIWSTH